MASYLAVRSRSVNSILANSFLRFHTAKPGTHLYVARKAFSSSTNGLNSSGVQTSKGWEDYRQPASSLLMSGLRDNRYKYNVSSITKLPKSYNGQLAEISKLKAFGASPLLTHYANPVAMVQFAAKYLLSYRFLFIYMARTAFQAIRPLLAFCVFGEIMKLILANISGGVPAFLFSFVLAFEVLYFFLQCYISYTFLTMFFTVMF